MITKSGTHRVDSVKICILRRHKTPYSQETVSIDMILRARCPIVERGTNFNRSFKDLVITHKFAAIYRLWRIEPFRWYLVCRGFGGRGVWSECGYSVWDIGLMGKGEGEFMWKKKDNRWGGQGARRGELEKVPKKRDADELQHRQLSEA